MDLSKIQPRNDMVLLRLYKMDSTKLVGNLQIPVKLAECGIAEVINMGAANPVVPDAIPTTKDLSIGDKVYVKHCTLMGRATAVGGHETQLRSDGYDLEAASDTDDIGGLILIAESAILAILEKGN